MMIMGGGGSMQNMRNALKANKNVLKRRNFLFKRKEEFSGIRNKASEESDLKEIYVPTNEERIALRNVLRAKRRKYRFVLVISSIALLGLMTWAILTFAKPFQKDYVSPQTKEQMIHDAEAYAFYMKDGDIWFAKNKWHNAIYQYENALQKEPNSFTTQIKLAYAYLNQCKFENEGCIEGVKQIDKLSLNYPNNPQVQVLEIEMKDMYIYKNEKASEAL